MPKTIANRVKTKYKPSGKDKKLNDMENSAKICQSCGMPISEDKHKGTNEDGSLSDDYCSYCFKRGKFTRDIAFEEQVETGLSYYAPYKNAKTQEEKDLIKQQTRDFLSTLKRWKS